MCKFASFGWKRSEVVLECGMISTVGIVMAIVDSTTTTMTKKKGVGTATMPLTTAAVTADEMAALAELAGRAAVAAAVVV